jgi:hypothetical protein
MAKLKDYLGSLVKDLNEARYRADIESARIAQLYANDPILKHFSVPRMKILETELTIPIAIESLEHSVSVEHDPIDNNTLFKEVYNEVKDVLETKSFNANLSKSLKKSIYEDIKNLETEIKGGEDTIKSIENFANKVASRSIGEIKKDPKERVKLRSRLKKIDIVSDDLKREHHLKTMLAANMKQHLVKVVKAPRMIEKIENAHITAESAKLKEYSPQQIVYIKMKVTEESMEWQTMLDDEGKVVPKLMAE